jgi:hypothetical protein
MASVSASTSAWSPAATVKMQVVFAGLCRPREPATRRSRPGCASAAALPCGVSTSMVAPTTGSLVAKRSMRDRQALAALDRHEFELLRGGLGARRDRNRDRRRRGAVVVAFVAEGGP